MIKVTLVAGSLIALLGLSLRAQASEAPFSTNDLSILFPHDNALGILPKYAVHPGDLRWRVLTIENFNALIKNAQDQGVYLNDKFRDPKTWVLVALRYAPCVIFAGTNPDCKEQIRLVFQPWAAEGQSGFSDYSIHVVYSFSALNAPTVTDRLASFRAIKNRFSKQTLDIPLGVHPVLQTESGQAYFDMIQHEVVEKHLNTRPPTLITFIGLGQDKDDKTKVDSDHWVFFTGNVIPPGLWIPAPLNVGTPLLAEHLHIDPTDETSLLINISVPTGDFAIFSNKSSGDVSPDSGARDIETSFKILDQHLTNDHNVDCASCHNADGHVFQRVFDEDDISGKSRFLEGLMATMKGKPRVSELLIDDTVHAGRIPDFEIPPVRIFGYLYDHVLISQRVVNDSSLAVEQANQLLGLSVQPQCPKDSQREALIKCIYFSPNFGPTPKPDFKTCLRQFCQLGGA